VLRYSVISTFCIIISEGIIGTRTGKSQPQALRDKKIDSSFADAIIRTFQRTAPMVYTLPFFMVVFEITIATLFPAVKFLKSSTTTSMMSYTTNGGFEKRMTWLWGSLSSIKPDRRSTQELLQPLPLPKRK